MTPAPAVLRSGSNPLAMKWDFENMRRAPTATAPTTWSTSGTRWAAAWAATTAQMTSSIQDGQQTLADYVAGTAAASPTYKYIYGSYIDEPVLRTDSSGNELYYHRNQQYSIVALTNASGGIVERYAYTAYGEPTILSGSGSQQSFATHKNRYQYTGREWDEKLELYHYRARMYSPVAGRFVGRDPIGYVDGGFSLFEFVRGGPVTLADPFGLCADPKQCWNDYLNGLRAADALRQASRKDLAKEVVDMQNRLADEALKQYQIALQIAERARQRNLKSCDAIDRSTIAGTSKYIACVLAAESAYYAAGSVASIVYAEAYAAIAGILAAHHAARWVGIEAAYILEKKALLHDYDDCMRGK